MNAIWDGPRRKDGSRIRIGWRPGAKFWDKQAGWLNYICDDDGKPIDALEFGLGTRTYAFWVKRDPSFDWHTITLDNFEEWYDSFYDGFARMDMLDDDVDYRRFVKAGTKLIISIGTEDEYVPCDALIDYYKEIGRVTFNGDMDKMRENIRLVLQPGNDHAAGLVNDGFGSCLSDSMIALMKWAEEGVAPDAIPAVHISFVTNGIDREGEVYAY
ncbi:MAG: tannase/feruloyl esterase family alpha/beta hydrolase [Coriobacteriaceae bacterium]|nr:tannase/feruloyl esterase family alpha/beta hydrolase [Coriobacteriaceae bacterium]